MFYTEKNFKSKKDLKAAVAAGEKHGIYAPGMGTPPVNGRAAVGGPHYPEPHKWYAQVTLTDGVITKVS